MLIHVMAAVSVTEFCFDNTLRWEYINCMVISKDDYITQLLGKVNYVLSVVPDNDEMLAYRQWLVNQKNNAH